jgi:hypothetical protein
VLDVREVTSEHYQEFEIELSESAILETHRRHSVAEIATTSSTPFQFVTKSGKRWIAGPRTR